MSKHTPGPWARSVFYASNGDESIGVKSLATSGAVAWISGANNDETNENARLIAVAPELLDALQRVMRHIPDNAGGASLSDDMHRAKKAITKATGA